MALAAILPMVLSAAGNMMSNAGKNNQQMPTSFAKSFSGQVPTTIQNMQPQQDTQNQSVPSQGGLLARLLGQFGNNGQAVDPMQMASAGNMFG